MPAQPLEGATVSVCILTHARTALLREAVWSALQLEPVFDYNIEVLNDCPEQTLTIDHPRVRVRNTSSIYTSVGAKRNAAAEMASGQWIAWLDDDDVLLPHHLRKLKLVGDAAVLTCDGSYWFCGNKGEVSSGGAIAGIMRRDAVLATRFIDASAGEDTTMVRNLATRYGEVKDPTFDPSYVQRWCNGAHHISGSGANPAAHVPFRKNVLERIRDRREPVGYLKIIPTAPEYDYTALTQPIILDHWEKHRELMARLGVERRKL